MKQIKGVVFDLYGTLFDVHSVAARCESFYPQRGREISLIWRQKQLEYTWLRSLMRQYQDFERATEDALVYACQHLGLDLTDARKQVLCNEYLRITPFPEVPAALQAMRDSGLPLAILSNGSINSIDTVVKNAGLYDQFAHLISVDAIKIFKPDARVYALAEQMMQLDRNAILFVSSNAWDVTGAGYYGYPTCWINRGGSTFDELGRRPDHIAHSINALADLLTAAQVDC